MLLAGFFFLDTNERLGCSTTSNALRHRQGPEAALHCRRALLILLR